MLSHLIMLENDFLARQNKKEVIIITSLVCAADENRTRTGITTHGILSPGRLPVPPLRHKYLIE